MQQLIVKKGGNKQVTPDKIMSSGGGCDSETNDYNDLFYLKCL